jgi:nitroreductase
VVSGEKVKALSAAILQAYEKEEFTPDFSFDVNHFYGRYGARQQEQGKAYYESMGVAREDKAGRKAALEFAYQFFGAPHVAFLFLPSFGDHVRVVADVGLYGQTLLLSLVDHGLAGIPMTSLGYFADIIRKVLGISEEFKLLFGIPFGYADEEAPGASFKLGRDPLFSNVVFHQ